MMTTAFEVISRFDDAIDAEAMGPENRVKYRETGDMSLIRIREGMTPVRFFCRRLKSSEMQQCMAHRSEADIFAAAFARGVTKVDGLFTEDGGRRTWSKDGERPVAQTVIDELFAAGEVQEVGAAIYGRSVLGKGRPAAWPLPAISQHAVAALVSHRVEQMIAQAATSAQSSGPAAEAVAQPSSV